MTDPDEIAAILAGDAPDRPLVGRRVLITAGPTWEAIDPVRGITNHSSGKMGYALAEAAIDCGAEVMLVSGPVQLETPQGAERIDVQSALDMLEAVTERIQNVDFFIAVAAVADYRPVKVAEHKIKKTEASVEMTIHMVKNPDILATVGAMRERPFCVGFAAETENHIANARAKLQSKNVDMIASNNVAGDDSAFSSDQNAVTLVHANGETNIPTNDKYAVAISMWRHILEYANSKTK